MAAKKETQDTKLVLKVVTGSTGTGKAITAARSFTDVNPAISDDDMLTIAGKLGKLQSHDVSTVTRVDSATLVEQA